MKLKKCLTLLVGIVTGFGLSIAGLSYASQNGTSYINLITSEKARTIMLEKVPGATIQEFSYDGDDKTPKYEGTLIKGEYEYEIDVNAKTGKILKYEKEKITISSNTSNSTSNSSNLITKEKAKTIMLEKVPGATIQEFSYDGDEKTPKYEGTLVKDGYKYEIDVDAKTGQIIKYEKEKLYTSNNNSTTSSNNSTGNSSNSTTSSNNSTGNSSNSTTSSNNSTGNSSNSTTSSSNNSTGNSSSSTTSSNNSSYIGTAKAKSIMLGKVPGATIREFHLDGGRNPEYEAELIKGDIEYEISIDAITGAIREFSQERIYRNNNSNYDKDYDDDDDRYDYDDDDDYDDRYDD